MKTSMVTTLVVLSAIGLTAGAAVAKPGDRRAGMSFEQLDTNGDGEITRAEIDAVRSERFAEADVDGDGMISLEEFTAQAVKRAEERAGQMFARLDKNADGMLRVEDLSGGPRAGRMFGRLDSNNDGVITQAEFDEARQKAGKRWGKGARSE